MTQSRQLEAEVANAGSTGRDDHDIFRLAPSMDTAVLETIATRLEFRGTDEGYARRSQAYFARLQLAQARRLTAQEGLSGNVTYQVADAHHAPHGDAEFDIVILHTLISHVDDPPQVLAEARRLVRPGGTVAIFDGDYASLTFAHPDHALATTIEEKLIQLIVANPRIMRDLPRLVREAGLELVEADGTLYANIGSSRFWVAATESYGGLLGRSGLLPQTVVDDWRAFQVQAVADNTFFGASNYYTYLTRRPE